MKRSIKEAAKARNLGLYSLSEQTGISVSQLYMIERNPKINVTVGVLEKLYKTTGIRPSEYLDRDLQW